MEDFNADLLVSHGPPLAERLPQIAALFAETFNAPPRREHWTLPAATDWFAPTVASGFCVVAVPPARPVEKPSAAGLLKRVLAAGTFQAATPPPAPLPPLLGFCNALPLVASQDGHECVHNLVTVSGSAQLVYLAALGVVPAQQRNGLGYAMAAVAIAHAFTGGACGFVSGASGVVARVRDDAVGSRHILSAFGFASLGRVTSSIGGETAVRELFVLKREGYHARLRRYTFERDTATEKAVGGFLDVPALSRGAAEALVRVQYPGTRALRMIECRRYD